MVHLFEQDTRVNERQSSKGNQLKWENRKIWYKADYTGYEGLAEYVISNLLQKSDLEPAEYVVYDTEEIQYRGNRYLGCSSHDFRKEGWQLITLERLFQSFFGESLYKGIYQIGDHKERLAFLVNQMERITGLERFGIYMSKLLTIDAFFLNEDRHMHNIAILTDGNGNYEYCPIFDNGAGLLSDTTMDYPLEDDFEKLMKKAKAKTFCLEFDEQLDIAEELYGTQIKFSFERKDVIEILEAEKNYSKETKERVLDIVGEHIRKYRYLFD